MSHGAYRRKLLTVDDDKLVMRHVSDHIGQNRPKDHPDTGAV